MSKPHKSINNLIKCAERELDFRKRVYPYQVLNGKKTQGQADYEIQCMNEIANILGIISRHHLHQSFNCEHLTEYSA